MNKLQFLHLLYLAYVLLGLSWASFRTKVLLERARAAAEGAPRPGFSRERILRTTLVSLLALFLASWVVAERTGLTLFAAPPLGLRHLAAAALVFAMHFALRRVGILLHSREELKRSLVRAWIPRTAREWTLYVLVALFAGVAEEAAYRGVAWTLLTWYTGNAWISALICAIAFGLAHATQRWQGVLIIFAIALMMHTFVAFAGSLVPAMIVHSTYDVAVGVVISRRLAKEDASD